MYSCVMVRPWSVDLAETSVLTTQGRDELPKPPGYSEQLSHDSVRAAAPLSLGCAAMLTTCLAFAGRADHQQED